MFTKGSHNSESLFTIFLYDEYNETNNSGAVD